MHFPLSVIVFVCVLCAFAAPAVAQDRPGYFRTVNRDGRWWLTDPDGQLFLSKGVTTISYAQDRIRATNVSPYEQANNAKYGSPEAWRDAVAKRLVSWGFNSVGSWSDEKLCQVGVGGKNLVCSPTLNLGATFVRRKMPNREAWLHGIFPDVFDPEFKAVCDEVAKAQCSARKQQPWLMGWFTDNELRWGPDWRGKDELLTLFLALPAETPGRVAAIEMLRRRHGEIAHFNQVWKTAFSGWDELKTAGAIKPPVVRKEVYAQNQEVERQENEKIPNRAFFVADCEEFVGLIADRYFSITAAAIKAADPNHLNFGARFAYVPPKAVVQACVKYTDVVSFNCYSTDPKGVIQAYSVFNKPLLIGEFSFRGKDSGLPNTKGTGPVVATQQDRASAFARYVTIALAQPNLVGYHWFEHADEPKEGRFDGEDSNYGVVDIKDEPYELLVSEMKRINDQAEELHRK